SGEVIFSILQSAGLQCFYTEAEPATFNRFTRMFICLGSWPDTYNMTLNQVNKIRDYIQNGHCVYLEGADAWAYSPYHDLLAQAFGIIGLWDGPNTLNISPLLGVSATFSEGMSFNSANTHYVDIITAASGSDLLFVDADTCYGVAQDTPNRKTVGLSFELGGLSGNNPSSSQRILLRNILRFFTGPVSELAGQDFFAENALSAEEYEFKTVYPNPFNPTTTLTFTLPTAAQVTLEVFDVKGRSVGAYNYSPLPSGTHQITFDGSGLPSGIYFARLQAGEHTAVQKLVLMK
ncbi:MAG: T9SS type A sorting domain-containing protein, partial [bacterium]